MLNRTTWLATILGSAVMALGVTFAASGGQPARAAEARRPVPPGLPPVFWPEDNPYSADKAELGRLLYFAPRLSSDATISCASCHDPKLAFTDDQAVSTGIGKQKGKRSAPTVINRAWS